MEKQEPYVKLLNGNDFDLLSDEDLIVINQNNRQSIKSNFYRLAFDFIKDSGIRGDYLEFGVHKARTFRMALSQARMQKLSEMNFWAFDSFEGLPQSNTHNHERWVKGALSTSEDNFLNIIKTFNIFVDKVKCVKGFYSEVLTKSFTENFQQLNNKAAFVAVACDLYQTAVPVFEFIEYVIQPGTVIYIDDFFVGHKGDTSKGVAKAFGEFAKNSRFQFIEFLSIGWWGKAYIVKG